MTERPDRSDRQMDAELKAFAERWRSTNPADRNLTDFMPSDSAVERLNSPRRIHRRWGILVAAAVAATAVPLLISRTHSTGTQTISEQSVIRSITSSPALARISPRPALTTSTAPATSTAPHCPASTPSPYDPTTINGYKEDIVSIPAPPGVPTQGHLVPEVVRGKQSSAPIHSRPVYRRDQSLSPYSPAASRRCNAWPTPPLPTTTDRHARCPYQPNPLCTCWDCATTTASTGLARTASAALSRATEPSPSMKPSMQR